MEVGLRKPQFERRDRRLGARRSICRTRRPVRQRRRPGNVSGRPGRRSGLEGLLWAVADHPLQLPDQRWQIVGDGGPEQGEIYVEVCVNEAVPHSGRAAASMSLSLRESSRRDIFVQCLLHDILAVSSRAIRAMAK